MTRFRLVDALDPDEDEPIEWEGLDENFPDWDDRDAGGWDDEDAAA